MNILLSQLCIMLILPIRSHCEIGPLPTIQLCWEGGGGGRVGGGGADDKFVILLVKKGYSLVSAFSQSYRTPPPASCDTTGFTQIPGFIISSTVILAADWSIAVGYWIVFHCFSLNGNVRIRISVLSPLSKFYPTSPWQLWV